MKKLLSAFLTTIIAMSVCMATASAAVSTVNLPTKNGQSYTWEAEDYSGEFPANNAVAVATSTYDVGSNTAHSEPKASEGKVLQSGGVTDVPVTLTLPIYAPTEIEYELEVVAAGGNTVFNTDYFTLDGDTIFTTNASPTNGLGGTVTATRLGWKTKSGNNSDFYEAVKYTTRITIPAGNHNLAFVVPKRETANWGSFMLDYIKLTSCAPETIIDCKIDVEGENYVGKYYIENNSEVEPSINMLLMLATYDENNVMTAITPVPIIANATAKTGSIPLPKAGTSKARMFLWSGTDYVTAGEAAYINSVVVNNE